MSAQKLSLLFDFLISFGRSNLQISAICYTKLNEGNCFSFNVHIMYSKALNIDVAINCDLSKMSKNS